MIKHLQNLTVPYNTFDNPYNVTQETVCNELIRHASSSNIKVDVDQTRLWDQQYINYLHELYENGYNGNYDWLLYHEAIHALEVLNGRMQDTGHYKIDYRSFAGPVQVEFTPDDLLHLMPEWQVVSGDCYIRFSELGKTPYQYWFDNEPNDLDRVIELAKPMKTFRPMLCIAVVDGRPSPTDALEFTQWFSKYKSEWCHHWGLEDWTLEQMFGVIKLGRVTEFDLFHSLIKNKDYICKTKLTT